MSPQPASPSDVGGSSALIAEEEGPLARGLGLLVDWIRLQMSAQTATILMLDRTQTALEPIATVGLERTLRRARRIRLGEGFAGRIAQTRQPLALTEISSETVVNPVLVRSEVQMLLGVPILAGSELLGVLHVGFHSAREPYPDELVRLADLADEIGILLRERSSRETQSAALTLRRSLLPEVHTVPEGLEVATHYLPAEDMVGGGWYDVFDLPDGSLGLVVGDVEGGGLDAAIVMGRIRTALRAYALDYRDPAQVLSRLDREACYFEPGTSATVLLGLADEPYETWRFSSAGHCAPFYGGPGMQARQSAVVPDRALGIDPRTSRHTTTLSIPVEGFLCLFNNGLLEPGAAQDRDPGTVFDENVRLLAASLAADADPRTACTRVFTEVVGDHLPEDDIVILIARRSPQTSLP